MAEPLLLQAASRVHSVEIAPLLVELGAASQMGVPMRVDLRGVGFATPSGVLWLLAALRTVRRGGVQIEVLAPPDTTALHHWMQWMGVYEQLRAVGIRCDAPGPAQALPTTAQRRLISQSLLPIISIGSAGDVATVAQAVVGHVGTVLEEKMGYGRRDVATVALVLAEACNNIWEHAGEDAVGFVAAQLFYPRQGAGGRPYLLVGIADDGCGIRHSLSRAHAPADDAEAVRAALTSGVSGVPDEERGLGLHTVASEIVRYRGTVHLRSGAAHLRLKTREAGAVEEKWYPSPAQIPGTMLCLTLQALDNA